MEYFDGGDDRFSDRRPADKLLSEIFGKPGLREADACLLLYLKTSPQKDFRYYNFRYFS